MYHNWAFRRNSSLRVGLESNKSVWVFCQLSRARLTLTFMPKWRCSSLGSFLTDIGWLNYFRDQKRRISPGACVRTATGGLPGPCMRTLAWILLVVSTVATFRGFSLQLSFQPSDLCSVAPGKEQSVGDSVQIMPTGFWTYNSQFRSSRAGLGQADWRRDRAALVMCPIWDLPLVAYRVN